MPYAGVQLVTHLTEFEDCPACVACGVKSCFLMSDCSGQLTFTVLLTALHPGSLQKDIQEVQQHTEVKNQDSNQSDTRTAKPLGSLLLGRAAWVQNPVSLCVPGRFEPAATSLPISTEANSPLLAEQQDRISSATPRTRCLPPSGGKLAAPRRGAGRPRVQNPVGRIASDVCHPDIRSSVCCEKHKDDARLPQHRL